MKEMNIEQVHECCLNISKEFVKICDHNNIPYYMLGGTMLGAVRHNGFIPWDDDMDFGVPYEYYDKLIDILNTELPKPYRCCTYKTHKCVFFPFIKIENMKTILNDASLPVPFEQKIGVNIDVFPLFHCSADNIRVKIARMLIDIEGIIFTESRRGGMVKHLIRSILRKVLPFNAETLSDISIKIIKKAELAPFLYNVYGAWSAKECIPENWYGTNILYNFEDQQFHGIKEFDKYLKRMYGEYMVIPSEESRSVHSTNAFLK